MKSQDPDRSHLLGSTRYSSDANLGRAYRAYAQAPKPAVGERPIALTPMLYRLLMRLNKAASPSGTKRTQDSGAQPFVHPHA